MTTTTIVRDSNGRFLPGNPPGPGRPTKEREEKYRQAVLQSCPPEKFASIMEQAATDALNKRSWKCRNAARDFLIKALARVGILSEMMAPRTNIGIFTSGEQIQKAIAERLQTLMADQTESVVLEVTAECEEADENV